MKWWRTLKVLAVDRLEAAYIEALGWLLGKLYEWAIKQQTIAQRRLDLRAEEKAGSPGPALSEESADMMFPQDMISKRPTWTGFHDER